MLMMVNVGAVVRVGDMTKVILFHDYDIYHDIALNKCIMVSNILYTIEMS